MRKTGIPASLYPLISLGGMGFLVFLWWLVTELSLVEPLFVPSPQKVLTTFRDVLLRGYRGVTLLEHLGHSMFRVLAGYTLAVLTAVPLGLLMGRNKVLHALFDPLIEMYRPLPPLAYYTLLIVWMGIDNGSKIALLYLAAFPPLSISAMAAVKRIPAHRLECSDASGYRDGLSCARLSFHQPCPESLPA